MWEGVSDADEEGRIGYSVGGGRLMCGGRGGSGRMYSGRGNERILLFQRSFDGII